MKITEILVKPILTEKATTLAQGQVYMFEVNPKANKNQIKTALEKLYKVKVANVRTMTRQGKVRRVGRRMTSKRLGDQKVAYIILKEGKIDLFPQA
jgi:large subunit ribosomal protein L23